MAQLLTTTVQALAMLLRAKGMRMVTAESCTGGGIAEALTRVAGSSDWFECGFVTYSNGSKQSMLGVKDSTLAMHGAVSEATVMEMALGAVANSNAQVAVAVSGVAGPGGGTPDKPVGCVWLAWLCEGRGENTACLHFQGDREAVRCQAIDAALQGLLTLLSES